jgi:hypothetical protein
VVLADAAAVHRSRKSGIELRMVMVWDLTAKPADPVCQKIGVMPIYKPPAMAAATA